MRDGSGQSEAKAGAFLGPAGVQASEPAQGLASEAFRDARPAIRNFDADLLAVLAKADADLGALGVANSVFDQIAERLGEELAVPVERYLFWRAVVIEPCARFF